jgi:hypothetical protein
MPAGKFSKNEFMKAILFTKGILGICRNKLNHRSGKPLKKLE